MTLKDSLGPWKIIYIWVDYMHNLLPDASVKFFSSKHCSHFLFTSKIKLFLSGAKNFQMSWKIHKYRIDNILLMSSYQTHLSVWTFCSWLLVHKFTAEVDVQITDKISKVALKGETEKQVCKNKSPVMFQKSNVIFLNIIINNFYYKCNVS